ncbi:sugar phosphate isomerase/epimerase family protein [Streptomyces sp. NBC_01197]|uniref:sugar phosphate isomerase/epimerase family protein n=1 Tax=Streptomyces sp. NBC_01197 TaxID=2903768 RepID=UPI002E0DD9BA|nr:sugar phosphate isomerase/epimerase [Streptomyces sp. NBC_01197]
MKFAFSTLGVPGITVPDVVRLAADSGYQGVELRAHPEEAVHPGTGLRERTAAAEEFVRGGVEILGVAGYVRVAAPGDDKEIEGDLAELVFLAADLGAPFVRVFPGGGGQEPAEADAAAARRLGAAAEVAADKGVRILLETHDSHRTGADAARVLGPVGHRNVGALWDVMHTWLGGESPAASHAVLAPHLGYAQVKDIASAEDTTPLALGAGVLPLAECVELLAPDQGWLCWEYEKRWYPHADELPGLLTAGREHLERLVTGDGAAA